MRLSHSDEFKCPFHVEFKMTSKRIVIAVGCVMAVLGLAATAAAEISSLERRYNASVGIKNPPRVYAFSQSKAAPAKAVERQVAAAPATVATAPASSFTSVGKNYKSAAPCLTDAWLAGVRDEAELRAHCPGK